MVRSDAVGYAGCAVVVYRRKSLVDYSQFPKSSALEKRAHGTDETDGRMV